MEGKNSFIDKLIHEKDKQNPETYLKGRFFVVSMILFFFLCFSAIPYFAIAHPEEIRNQFMMFVFNLIMLAFVVIMMFIYKKFGQRIWLVNILTFLGYLGNVAIYENGGIYAVDNMWGFLIASWVFLLANKRSGFVWFGLVFIQLVFFYYADLQGWRDFSGDMLKSANYQSGYIFMNFFLGALFLMLIIYLHERSKEQFLKIIVDSKEQLEIKSKELETKTKDITDSINYAKRIQYAVLPQEESIYRSIPLSFIYYKPKDIVSGDFFWFHELDKDNYILVCADCTGHGVPGAFMTVIGSSLLNQTVIDNKITEPAKILIELDKLINFTLKQQKDTTISVQDGMDLALIKVNKAKKEFTITGAKRPVIFIRNKEMRELKGSKFSIGGLRTDEKRFEEITMNYQEEDMLYFYTDGYTDQFGGERGKKFSSKRLKEHFMDTHRLSVSEQKQKLDTEMNKWMGGLEQVDDMLVMGIKF